MMNAIMNAERFTEELMKMNEIMRMVCLFSIIDEVAASVGMKTVDFLDEYRPIIEDVNKLFPML